MADMYRCEDCGCVFAESEAAQHEFDMEDDLGVGGLFPDHHYSTCYACPECDSEDVIEYEPEEEEEEEEEVEMKTNENEKRG